MGGYCNEESFSDYTVLYALALHTAAKFVLWWLANEQSTYLDVYEYTFYSNFVYTKSPNKTAYFKDHSDTTSSVDRVFI